MPIDTTTPRSRRALLAGALGGLGATLAAAVARSAPVEAAAGDPVRAGRVTRAGPSRTSLQSRSGAATFRATNSSSTGAGLSGISTNGTAVSGSGVYGRTASGLASQGAVKGENVNYGSVGYLGRASTGVVGFGDIGVEGQGSTYGGFFGGRTGVRNVEFQEIDTPGAPAGNRAYLFVRDNGSGRSQLCVRFASGAVQVIATQP